MKLSQLFTKTLKQAPSDEHAKNAQLLIRAGFVYKVMAGVYAYTPLGLRVLENIKQIVREEMNAVGGSELVMTTLQPKETWEATGRWSDEAVDVWFKSKLQDETEIGFGWSHEEAILDMMRGYVRSYKDLPVSVYQIQTKLRNELRAKSGVMRGREFVMKDMYSLHATEADCDAYYDTVIKAYDRVYDRLGLGDRTFMTFASGGSFTKFSHEFQTICDAGEDILYTNEDKTIAVNEEVLEDATRDMAIDKSQLQPTKSAEVGNVFKFGTQKAEQMNIMFTDEDGTQKPVWLASYGIGITRLLGVIVEVMSDENGIIWPEAVAPARVHIVQIGDEGRKAADELYQELTDKGVAVLYDDRNERPGAKFADAELMGVPTRVTVSDRTVEAGAFEVVDRKSGEKSSLTKDQLFAIIA